MKCLINVVPYLLKIVLTIGCKLKNAIRKKNKLFNTYKTKNCPITYYISTHKL